GLAHAAELGASEVEVVGDSELVAKQVQGLYKVRNAAIRPLHARALQALGRFERWSIRTVPRAQNADADALVNQTLDAQ
ncbi:MAG TPA: reverse transcriptase-like protein, partial [Solirubrobacteraceae bacterium]|nr:reverse transcriptase-like protein [Solirubrobacteraceae bacterium]